MDSAPRTAGTTNGRDDAPPTARRKFFSRLTVGLTALAAAVVGVPLVASLISPLTRPVRRSWRRVGRLDDFPLGLTVKVTYRDPEPLPWAGPAAESAAWVRRVGQADLVAFTIYCTHVGCPTRWEEGAQLFMCPCHGGVFYRDGTVASGPPPVPLPRIPVRVRDGAVELLAGPIPLPR